MRAESIVKARVDELLVSFNSCFGTLHLAWKLFARAQSSSRTNSIPEKEMRASLVGELCPPTGSIAEAIRPKHVASFMTGGICARFNANSRQIAFAQSGSVPSGGTPPGLAGEDACVTYRGPLACECRRRLAARAVFKTRSHCGRCGTRSLSFSVNGGRCVTLWLLVIGAAFGGHCFPRIGVQPRQQFLNLLRLFCGVLGF